VRLRHVRAWLGATALLATPAMAELPAGTVVEVRLLTPVSSYSSRAGTEVRALVLGAVCPDTSIPFPTGTVARGTVKHVRKVGLGLVYETARIELDFRELMLPGDEKYPLEARLVSVENAREHVDRRGVIHGARATDSLSNRLGSRIALEALEHPLGLFTLVFALENTVFRFPDPEITFGSGTELHLEIEGSVPVPLSGCPVEPVAPLDEPKEMQQVVNAVPYWTYSKRDGKPVDPTNLLFVGSQEELERAFAAAGWTGARAGSAASALHAIRALVENRGYDEAPMKTLLLGGEEPEITRQKTLNTLIKRDHLRIWKQPEQIDGRMVWASAATRDIGAGFSLRPFGFTHAIQDDVDLERNKVVSDLVFTGCVESSRYVDRPEVLDSSEYGQRKRMQTDGRVAVVVLNSCETPVQAPVFADDNPVPAPAIRVVRRLALTTRNHFLRDNPAWHWSEGAYMVYRAIRTWHEQRASIRKAQEIRADHASLAHTHVSPGIGFAAN